MTPEEMCSSCIHNGYCSGAYKKDHWCGNHTTKEGRLYADHKDSRQMEPGKVWVIKKYFCGTFYVNQEIKGEKFYDRDRRMTKKMLVSIGVLA